MIENQPNQNDNQSSSTDAWQEVGRQFQALGDSIAQAFRVAWNDEENRRRMEQMRSGLESMVNEVGRTIDETAKSPEGQKVRAHAEQAAGKLRNAGEQTVQEVRPHLVNALTQLNAELQKMIDRMEKKESDSGSSGGPTNE